MTAENVPSTVQLLAGVARFLSEDVRAAVKDPGVRFRALVAANLVRIAIAEHQVLASPDGDPSVAKIAENRAMLSTNAADDDLVSELAAELRIANPRFDLRDDIEALADVSTASNVSTAIK